VFALRACNVKLEARREDQRSRRETLHLTGLRESVGQVAPIETARAKSASVDALTLLANQEMQCAQFKIGLAVLTGWTIQRIDTTFGASPEWATTTKAPHAPALSAQVGLPGRVLLRHPTVMSTLRSADAAFEDIGSAKAARYPSLSLSAVLGQSWLRALGHSSNTDSWSLGSALSGVLFDNGAGNANIAAAQARYKLALAQLESTVRTSIQEIENSLSSLANAQERERLSQEGFLAAKQLLDGSQASYHGGRMSLFELEDARRSFNNAVIARIDAHKDRAQSWVALVKATGNAIEFQLSP
jgi:outer membrane protein, multidrug efflux system